MRKSRFTDEQVVAMPRRLHPNEPTLQVSYETIYTALYVMPRGELRTELVGLSAAGSQESPAAPGAKIAGALFPT